MQKTGNECFTNNGESKGFELLEFWRYCASDLLDNTLRGTLAEFIVARALGVSEPRGSWGAYDIDFNEWKVEVKAAAYIQSWKQRKVSKITFSIRPTRSWTPDSGYSGEVKRQSDIYVFCLLSESNPQKVDPLALDQWEFFPVLTTIIDKIFANQKSVSLSSLMQKLNPEKCSFDTLRDTLINALNS